MFQQPEQKSSSESSEKCLSVDGIVHCKSGLLKWIGQFCRNDAVYWHVNNHIAEHQPTNHRIYWDSTQCLTHNANHFQQHIQDNSSC